MSSRFYDALIQTWARCFARPACRRLNNLLINLGSSGLGLGNADARKNGEMRILGVELAQRLELKSMPTIWDIGANEGEYVAMILECWPTACVHAFEPHPATYSRLEERYHGTSVACHPFALGAATQTLDLWDYADDTQGSSHATFYPDMVRMSDNRDLKFRSVKVRSIDDVAREEGVESIDLIKIDVEGHELACLEGAAEMLRRSAIGLVQFEFNVAHLEARVHMGDFADRLPGYDLFRILPDGLIPLNLRNPMLSNLYRMQNILAVPRRPVR
jgi:FkbM family methyltransferase